MTASEIVSRLTEYLFTTGHRLELSTATGCRCWSCNSYKFRDIDGKIVAEEEGFEDLIKGLPVQPEAEHG